MTAATETVIPKDLRDSLHDTAHYLSLASAIVHKQCPDGEPPGLLPALVLSLVIRHSTKETSDTICQALESIENRIADISLVLETDVVNGMLSLERCLDDLPDKMDVSGIVIERLAGIENELFRIANNSRELLP